MGNYGKLVKYTALLLLLSCGLLTGCVRQEAVLVYARPEDGPDASPTAAARKANKLTVDEITGPGEKTDDLGVPVLDGETHYFSLYISFADLRLYEEDGYTYLDGFAVNGYDRTLGGACDISFFEEDGSECGRGSVHTAAGNLILPPGRTRIYAEILSEHSVLDCDFTFKMTSSFSVRG